MTEPRYFRDGADGPVYRIRLVLRELAHGGVDPEMQVLMFEDILGAGILTVELHRMWRLDQLNEDDLKGLLEDARR